MFAWLMSDGWWAGWWIFPAFMLPMILARAAILVLPYRSMAKKALRTGR
jgi:hypothetical protein